MDIQEFNAQGKRIKNNQVIDWCEYVDEPFRGGTAEWINSNSSTVVSLLVGTHLLFPLCVPRVSYRALPLSRPGL